MAAGMGAIALWGALATLSVLAGPIPPFQMVAMTFAIATAIGITRARWRGVGWKTLVGWPARVWLLGIGGLFGYHALYFAALQLAPPAEANLVNYLWPLLIVLLSAPLAGERLGWPHLLGALLGFAGVLLLGNIRRKGAVIIAVTARASDDDRQRCVAAGMNGFLSKPLSRQSLFAELQRVTPLLDEAVPISGPKSISRRSAGLRAPSSGWAARTVPTRMSTFSKSA